MSDRPGGESVAVTRTGTGADPGTDLQIIESLARGELRVAARLISRIESGDPAILPLLAALHARGGKTPLIGITGPPGAGKSTLVDQLIFRYRQQGKRVAVLAVDPSSPFSGGAILGDRIRMNRHCADEGVFIRSMAARGRLGGLAIAAGDALLVLDAMGWDVILIETVGVGQSEIDILRHAHTVVIVQTPAGGDAVQALKAGVLEVGDIFVVNKADAAGADRTVSQLREALSFRSDAQEPESWHAPVLKTQAVEGLGIDELVLSIAAQAEFWRSHPQQRATRRRLQTRLLLIDQIAETLHQRQQAGDRQQRFEQLLDEVLARRCDLHTAASRLLDHAMK
jgi:LAO/AO transport system kinase